MTTKHTFFRLYLLSILLVFQGSLEARLGETIAECEQRYGQGKEVDLQFSAKLMEQIQGDRIDPKPKHEALPIIPLPQKVSDQADGAETIKPILDPVSGLELPELSILEKRKTIEPMVDLKLMGQEIHESDSLLRMRAIDYSASGLQIHIVFENNAAVLIKYQNEPIFNYGSNNPSTTQLAPDEIEFLKKSNRGSNRISWQRYQDPLLKRRAPMLATWRTSDRSSISGYNREQKELFACTFDFWNMMMAEVNEHLASFTSSSAESRFRGL